MTARVTASLTEHEAPGLQPVMVIHPRGELDIATAGHLRAVLLQVLAAGQRHAVVNMAGLTFCDATGLGMLVAAQRRYTAQSGWLRVTGLTPRLTRLFTLCALPSYPDLAHALQATA